MWIPNAVIKKAVEAYGKYIRDQVIPTLKSHVNQPDTNQDTIEVRLNID